MRSGIRLAVDVGSVRIGIARSDFSGTLAVPECTLAARGEWQVELQELVAQNEPIEIVVGLPVSLDGKEHAAAARVRDVVAEIIQCAPTVPVRLVDERMTTNIAHQQMREAGITTRKGRSVVDQAAAVIMLQDTLDAERSTGIPPGHIVDERTTGTHE